MSPEVLSQGEILCRLRCTEGHLRGIIAMVERGDDCLLVLHQIRAVQGALHEITDLVWRCRLRHSLRQRLFEAAGDVARQADWVAETAALYEALRA